MMKILMPSLGLTMEEGRIVEWLKKEGDFVEEGEPLFVVESEKATLEINASCSGFIQKILVEAFVSVPVGHEIARIVSDLNDAEADMENTAGEIADETEQKAEVPVADPKAESPGTEPALIKASPLARKLAAKNGIELSAIKGTGPDGRISREDVENAMALEDNGTPLSGIRGIIASRMSESSNVTAPVTLTCRADADELVRTRAAAAERLAAEGVKPSFNDIFCLIVRDALIKHPGMNAYLEEGRIYQNKSINIGIAVDAPAGLMVPVIKNVEKLSLGSIAQRSGDLVSRALEGKLLPDEMTGGSFTITNLGMFGIEFFTPIINMPQSAILGIGAINEVPVVRNGQITAGKKISLSLTFDHRVIDGAPAAGFLMFIKELIENIPTDYLGKTKTGV